MAELKPIPLRLLVRRALLEFERESKIFDLPASKFFRGIAGLDLSVDFHGHRAGTPLGPAAGPHGQLAQNVALAWLGGSRIIELKTVQILDELEIPRPCIDVANVGYNVEWSQELKLEQSLREYVKAAMLIEILKAAGVVPDTGGLNDTVFDMSVGYNLEGIRSAGVSGWIRSMQNAGGIVDDLRGELAGEFEQFRGLPFSTRISDTIALSTFHGCPAGEIEGIVTFLLAEMGCHVCIKLNPTLLGMDEVSRLLHDTLGYRDIEIHPPAFENDLRFDEALDLIPRLQGVAKRNGRSLSLKFTNTLVVKNRKRVFADEVMYLSGAPLHVLAMNLVGEFRARMPEPIPMSFSGGIDAHNMAAAVAMNFVPVTTCTDLLRPGGYARLGRYLENLGTEMNRVGATDLAAFVQKYRGQENLAGGSVHKAALLNTPILVAEATANPRYRLERNQGVPRKIGSQLWLYDCISCDKCVPVCPNDANFAYETKPASVDFDNYELLPEGTVQAVTGGTFHIAKARQFANYADACNDCGNCDVFCPEDGGPQVEKPRLFSSLESWTADRGSNAFFIDWSCSTIYGKFNGGKYRLSMDATGDRCWLDRDGVSLEIRLSDGRAVSWQASGTGPVPHPFDMLPYWKLKLLMESIGDTRHVNFANVAALEEKRA
jgi:putative selenate reductase